MDPVTLKAIVIAIVSWTAAVTGYAIPEQLPAVEFANTTTMIERGALAPNLVPIGVYVLSDDTILLDKRLDLARNICARSILVHETVHYLQDTSNAYADLPPTRRKQAFEIEAYGIQKLWLAEQRVYRVTPFLPMAAYFHESRCVIVPAR